LRNEIIIKPNRTIPSGFILSTRQVPAQSRGERKTRRIGGIEAEGPKEKGPNGGKGRELKEVLNRVMVWSRCRKEVGDAHSYHPNLKFSKRNYANLFRTKSNRFFVRSPL
jgi:hypothetical protein